MMKKNNVFKSLSLILCIVLIAAMALLTIGCSETNVTESPSGGTIVKDGETIGEGSISFPLTIVDKEGVETTITVNTNATKVGEALTELGIISGEQDDYGLYIKEVNGITADYDVDATYWAFYIDGEYAVTGVDMTDITEGASYTLKIES